MTLETTAFRKHAPSDPPVLARFLNPSSTRSQSRTSTRVKSSGPSHLSTWTGAYSLPVEAYVVLYLLAR